jgi:uncharacterized membrane protein
MVTGPAGKTGADLESIAPPTLNAWQRYDVVRRRLLGGIRQVTAGGWVRRHPHVVGVGVLTFLMAFGYSMFEWFIHYTFGTASYDLVIFDQAVRSYAHFQPGISIIKGLHNFGDPNFSVLGDHWSPILAVLAPLYWVFNSPVNLLMAQAVLFALAIPPVWLFTRRAFGGGRKATIAAYIVSAAYGLSWPIAAAAAFNFHEVAFAPVLTAVALERIQAGRLRTALIAMAGMLLVKEDMGLMVASIGLYLLIKRSRSVPRQRLVGLILIVVGLVDTIVAVYVLIPAFGGRSDYYWAYDAFGHNAGEALRFMISHPISVVREMVTPSVKLHTMIWLLLPFCFLSLLSPITITALPLLLERMLASQDPNWWVWYYQYNAFLIIPIVLGAVDGAARLQRWVNASRRESDSAVPLNGSTATPVMSAATASPNGSTASSNGSTASPNGSTALQGGLRRGIDLARRNVAFGAAVLFGVLALYTVPKFSLGAAFHLSFYVHNQRMVAEERAISLIPDGVTVQAPNRMGPHLSGRDTVLLWDGNGHTPIFTPWIIAIDNGRNFGWTSAQQEKERVDLLLKHGYVIVAQIRDFIVMHAPNAPGSGTTSAKPQSTG